MFEILFGFVATIPGLLASVALGGGIGWLLWWRHASARKPGEPTVVTGWLPYLGCAPGFGKHAGEFLARCQQQHGDTFTLYLAGRRLTFLLDPRDYPTVFHEHRDAFSFHDIAEHISSKAFDHPSFDAIASDYDLLTAITKEQLKGQNLADMTVSMQQNLEMFLAEEVSSSWQEKPLYAFVYEAMFAAGTHTVFGKGFHSAEIMAAFQELDEKFPLLVAGVSHRLLKTQKPLDALIERCAAAYPEDSRLVQERNAHMNETTDARTKGSFQVALLWAAQANTIPATFWSLAYILRTPEAHDAILEELAEVEVGAEGFTRSALMKMVRLESAISEALRLSTASMTIRRVKQGLDLPLASGKSIALRKGSEVALYPYHTHRDPEIFADPQTYQWDRFLATDGPPVFEKYGQRLKYALVPFGGGISLCPGRHFARNEIKLFVALVLSRYALKLEGDAWPQFEQTRAGLGILPPTHDISFQIRERQV